MNLQPITMDAWTDSMHSFSEVVKTLEWIDRTITWKECPKDIAYFMDQGEFDNHPYVYFFKLTYKNP